jgi:serine/threonine-protein kinase
MIRQALARGGMATVYYATGADGHDEVALKVSRFAETDRRYGNALRFEADLLEKLDHPNIVTIKPIPLPGAKIPPFSAKALQIRGHPWYYSMELLRGGSLLTYTEHSAALPVDAVVSMFYQVARGLMYLHRKGYAHLDVKAENVLFKYPLRKGALIQPVLVDFGVSAQTSRGMEAAGGTLLIMAPERLTAQQNSLRDMDAAKLDVYAMGITMYRVLAGRYPFTGFSQRALITAILNDPVRPLSEVRPDIPEGISALVMACLEKDHTSRPAMGHVVAQLERLPYRLSRLNRDLAR